jgi:hypothetical protein
VARYDGAANGVDAATAIALDSSGNVFVTGGSAGSGTGEDYATVKYSTSGTQSWASRYDGPGNGLDRAASIAVDGSGNAHVTGFSLGLSATSYDYATLKYNSSGTQQWAARYNGPANQLDAASAIKLDSTGTAHVTGRSVGSGTAQDFATIRYNTSGTQLWLNRCNAASNGDESAVALALDSSNNVYVTGSSWSNTTQSDYLTLKLSN